MPRKVYEKKANQKQLVLDYLRAHEGEIVSQSDISKFMGYSTPAPISRFLKELRQSRTIVRRGKWGYYTYEVKHASIRRGRPSNQAVSSVDTESKPVHAENTEDVYVGTVKQFASEFQTETGSYSLSKFLQWLTKTVKK